MLSISNLQEACEVLTKKTGRTWTDKMLLDFAQHTRQRLSASTPIDSIPVLYALRDEDGRVCFKEKFRLPPGHRPLLHLFPSQVLFLLIRGEVMAHHVDWGAGRQPEDTMELIEPEARILPKDVRLKRSALDAILQRWQQSQIRPGPISGLKNGKGEVVPGDTHHRWPAWVFDDDPSAEEKTSAEVPDPGHEPDGDPGTIAAASDDRKPTKGKKKKIKYSPSTVLQMQEDFIDSNGGSTRGVRQVLLKALGVSDTTVKNLLRAAKKERQDVEAARAAAGLWRGLVQSGKKS